MRIDGPIRLAAAAAVLATMLVSRVEAQEADCENALVQAEQQYAAGRFEDVLRVREACLGRKIPARLRLRALAVLARTHVLEDDLEAAREALRGLLAVQPNFTPFPDDPNRFVHLVEQLKGELLANKVATVSKVDEPLLEAPATVILITAEEIERRGYIDLEEIFHDLPGFDISRGNGDVYSNIYMRGYRSDRSDRMMFLIDGIEQNDLHSNTAYISRQYPLSNIAQIEVVYGPASTIYGPNAFSGVVSVTTKSPRDYVRKDCNGCTLGYSVSAGGGSFATSFVDATVAGTTGDLSWSVTGRGYRSDEQDLSRYDDWDFDYDFPDDYRGLLDVFGFEAFESQGLDRSYVDQQIEKAIAQDQELIARLKAEQADLFTFSDETRDWYFSGKLRVEHLTVGIEQWRREEGTTPWYTETVRTGSGNVLTPRQASIYMRYRRPVGNGLTLNLFSRYKEHELDGDSSISRLALYGNKFYDDADLFFKEIPFYERVDFDQVSTQARGEATLIYQRSEKFNMVAGVEYRGSTVQADFLSESSDEQRSYDKDQLLQHCGGQQTVDYDDGDPNTGEFPCNEPFFFSLESERRSLQSRDAGIFAQMSIHLSEKLSLVMGGRLDQKSNRADDAPLGTAFEENLDEIFTEWQRIEGDVTADSPAGSNEDLQQCLLTADLDDPDSFKSCVKAVYREALQESSKSVFNGRFALVYSTGKLVFKGIYAEAFKEGTNFQKYTREPFLREFQNPLLEPEDVQNVELSMSWESSPEAAVDVAAYESTYEQTPALQEDDARYLIPSRTNGFENLSGSLRVRGLQANARWKIGKVNFFGNYTYTDPVATIPGDPDTDEPPQKKHVGDIARYRLNLGAHLPFNEQLALNLRTNYVSARGTDAYLVLNGALTLRLPKLLPGATVQLIARNLLDETYDHPGVQLAGTFGLAPRLPQPGRSVFLRMTYK